MEELGDLGIFQLLDERLTTLLQGDLDEGSHRTYESHVCQFAKFCRLRGREPAPEPQLVCEFVLGRVLAGHALATIRGGVSAIARWARDASVDAAPVSLSAHPLVGRALAVAAKRAAGETRQKRPLALAQLCAVVQQCAQWTHDGGFMGARDAALFAVGWCGMMRSSELVAMQWEDVRLDEQGVRIRVPKSKTDSRGAGSWVFVAAPSVSGAASAPAQFCPAQLLRALRAFGGGASGPVFRASSRSPVALAKGTVSVRLRKALRAVGVPDSESYASHSLRRGGATHAAAVGVPSRLIMALGRWRSDAWRLYTYCAAEQLHAAARCLPREPVVG